MQIEKNRKNTFAEIVNNSVNPLLEAVDRLELRNVQGILLDRTDSTLTHDWLREVRRIPSYFLKRLTCIVESHVFYLAKTLVLPEGVNIFQVASFYNRLEHCSDGRIVFCFLFIFIQRLCLSYQWRKINPRVDVKFLILNFKVIFVLTISIEIIQSVPIFNQFCFELINSNS